MGFAVEGEYFEACTCTVSCPCIFLAPGTEEDCDVFLAWHIVRGRTDEVELDGLNAAMAVHSPKQMTDGNWTVALYLDERATPEQAEALGGIFSGQAGGHLANLGPLIGTVAGVSTAPITFESRNGTRRVRVGEVLEAGVEELTGGDAAIIRNAQFGAVTQPLRQGKSERVRYDGHWTAEASDRNAFLADFRYEG